MNDLTDLTAIVEWDVRNSAANAAIKLSPHKSEKLQNPEAIFSD
jgi:hypothetical protein